MSASPRLIKRAAKPTISDLADRLSLSKGTVSRILNDKGNAFSEETRSRVFTVAREIGYAPNPLARALATGKSGFVALWVQTLVTSYCAQIAHAMEVALEERGYQIAVAPFGRFSQNRERYGGTPIGVDGVIAHEIDSDIWPLLLRDVDHKVPVVTTGIFGPSQSRDHVQIDLAPAAADAARHLLARGYRRVAYASDVLPQQNYDARALAYNAVFAESGIPVEWIALTTCDRPTVRTRMREYFQAHGCPEALFCHNDDVALAAYRALIDLGMRIPDDCALIGCDGIPDTEYIDVPLTTIVQPYADLCETACRFLERRLAEPDAPPQQVTLPAKLEIRQST